MSQNKTEFKTEAPSLYKKAKTAEDQTQPSNANGGKDKKPKERRPKSEDAPRRKPNRNKGTVNPNTTTLYIGRVYYDELDQDDNISKQLNQERLKLLRDVFQRYGDVEKFEPHTAESFCLVTYKDRQSAEDAIANLTQRSIRDPIMDEIKETLRKRNLPDSVCPVLYKYRYEWSKTQGSDSPTQDVRPKTAVAKKPTEKKEQAPVVSGDQQALKKDKKRVKKGAEQTNEQPAQTKPEPKQEKKKETVPQRPPVQDLQLEAERARLTQDLEYLRLQHKSVAKELSAERDRCTSRDERIKRLDEEHGRIRQHALTLENQLKTDLNWKNAADERISKLQEEISHIQQQQIIVTNMLKTISEL